MIEHNLDVVKTADWIIDLGPDGAHGGSIVAQGPPEEVVRVDASHTAQACAGCYRSEAGVRQCQRTWGCENASARALGQCECSG